LLHILLGKWGDDHASVLIHRAQAPLDSMIFVANNRLKAVYSRDACNQAGDGEVLHKHSGDAVAAFQSLIGPAIKEHLFAALDEVSNRVAGELLSTFGRRIKEAERLRQWDESKIFDEAENAVLKTGKLWHRPAAHTLDSMERRSIEIIRAIGAGKGDKGKVALAFYGDFDLSKPSEKARLFQTYNNMEKRDRDACRSKYHSLLRSKSGQPTYESLLERARDENASAAHGAKEKSEG
jgi:hypothetical protein